MEIKRREPVVCECPAAAPADGFELRSAETAGPTRPGPGRFRFPWQTAAAADNNNFLKLKIPQNDRRGTPSSRRCRRKSYTYSHALGDEKNCERGTLEIKKNSRAHALLSMNITEIRETVRVTTRRVEMRGGEISEKAQRTDAFIQSEKKYRIPNGDKFKNTSENS